MKTKRIPIVIPFAAVLGNFLASWAFAGVLVTGVNTSANPGYAADASATDLVNAGAATLASVPAYSANPHFGGSPSAANDGTVGGTATSDITFWLNASAGATYSITYTLDISLNTFGYDINSIQTINGWSGNSGNQKNQNYTVEVSSVGSASFATIATVAYLPFGSGTTTGSTKVNITETSPGVFTVEVTPTTSGTVQLRIPAGAILEDAAGNALDTGSPIVAETILTADPSSLLFTTESSLGTPFASTPWAASLSATDLINAGQPTLADFSVSTAQFGGPGGINDGATGVNNTTANTFFSINNFPAIATYNLDTTVNTEGYDITSIESFLGWQANSSTHANQTYVVEVRLVGSPDYLVLAYVDYEPFGTANSVDHESHVVIGDSSGVLASGVDSIRFTFSPPASGGGSPGTVVREIDVFGAPTTVGLEITAIAYDPDADTVTLTWRKTGAASYVARYSLDMIDWEADLDDSITADRDENPGDADHLTVTFPLTGNGLDDLGELFFRVEKE